LLFGLDTGVSEDRGLSQGPMLQNLY